LLISLEIYRHFATIIQDNMLGSTPSYEREDFVGATFYCPHALADGTNSLGLGRRC